MEGIIGLKKETYYNLTMQQYENLLFLFSNIVITWQQAISPGNADVLVGWVAPEACRRGRRRSQDCSFKKNPASGGEWLLRTRNITYWKLMT